ncbi:UNVERIFIED_CONTAM: hypothetical protein PYX00_002753 [Menopon gallinae]|uniref:DH domain-containing protein n=1 Tax=Menopon gallinae TaxID=328185 RepID=A0AAW2HXA2_9NEOP
MSVYGDFHKVWMERFPNSELPTAWEEDVRSNLIKHRQKINSLKEELEKEVFYVEYLEYLLADVEKQKTRAAGDGEAASEELPSRRDSDESGIDSSEAMRKFSKSCSQNSIDLCISELADSAPLNERNKSSPPNGSERSISVDETQKKPSESDGEGVESRQRSLTQPNLSNFITVIEINGKGKKKVELPKKFPPKPPPKTFMKPNVDGVKKAEANNEEPAKKRAGAMMSTPDEPPSETEETAKSKPASESTEETLKLHNDSPYGKIKKPASLKTEEVIPAADIPNNRNSTEQNEEKEPDDGARIEESEAEYCTLASPLDAPKKDNFESVESKAENANAVLDCEPFYDSVPAEDSDGECVVEALTLPSRGSLRPSIAPSNANYVNIEYFIKQRPLAERSSSVESEEENVSNNSEFSRIDSGCCEDFNSLLLGNVSDGTYASNSSLESSGTKISGPFDLDPDDMKKKIIDSIIESEIVYIECLNVLLQYMKALKATLSTSQPVISEDELNTVFFKIPELHAMHTAFLDGLRNHPPYGPHFQKLAENLKDYGAFLHNYGRATDTVKRRCQNCQQFAEITSEIKLKSLQGQVLSLEDLLHKPVARVQKNALVLDVRIVYSVI